MYYPCSENKGADQLRGYREADLRLCFRLVRLLVFPCGGSFVAKQEETLRKHAHATHREFFSVVKTENFIGKFTIFLLFLLKTLIVGTHNLCFAK